MKVLDLFSGLGGFSQAFKDGHFKVYTIDINPKFKPSFCIDINEIAENIKQYKRRLGKPYIILASPPCNCFSVASIGKYYKNGIPNKIARKSIKTVLKTLDIIEELNPKYWVLENPRGMLRRILGKPKYFITQCQYGKEYMKPTDLWGVLPDSFKPKSCKNGDKCHVSAPRGSKKGLQAIETPEQRAKIPYGLSKAILHSCVSEYYKMKMNR